MKERVYKGDTAIIEANLFDEDGVSIVATTDVSWQVRKPDGTIVTGGPTNIERAEASIAFTDTDEPGPYATQVTFTLPDLSKRSTILSFEVIDPLETTNQADTPIDKMVDMAWLKLEDIYDSDLGGPYLRDATKASFDREKLKRLMPAALYNINNFYQPATNYSDVDFPYDQHAPLLAQAVLVEAVRHLMRSYVEQPLPSNAAPGYFSRRDYLNRWQLILQQEEKQLEVWLDLFKRGFLGVGSSSMLVGGYSMANRYPRYMGGRVPYVYRY
jgi:hypothetical protein